MSRVDPKKLLKGWDLEFLPDNVRKEWGLHYTSVLASPSGQAVSLAKLSRDHYSQPVEAMEFIQNGLEKGVIKEHIFLLYNTVTGEVDNSFTLYQMKQLVKGVTPRTVTFQEKDGKTVEHQTYFLDKNGNPAAHPLDNMDWPSKTP